MDIVNDFCCLEFSQHSADNGKFPWHVERLRSAVEKNASDAIFNNRGMNKWQIVLIGSFDECVRMIDVMNVHRALKAPLTPDAFRSTLETVSRVQPEL